MRYIQWATFPVKEEYSIDSSACVNKDLTEIASISTLGYILVNEWFFPHYGTKDCNQPKDPL